MPRCTVLHIITKLELGGAQENTLWTCRHLNPEKFAVALLFGPGGPLDKTLVEGEFEAHPIPQLLREIRPPTDLAATYQLYRSIRRALARHRRSGLPGRSFIVHTHSSKAGLLGRIAAKMAGVESIVHSIHGFGFHEGQSPLLRGTFVGAERVAANVTNAFISVSFSNLSEAQALGIVRPHHRAVVIRSGMDLRAFLHPADRNRAKQELGIPASVDLIVVVANLKPQKDPMTLVEAFADLRRTRPNTVLLYAGDGPLRGPVMKRLKELGLETAFRLLGWRTDVPSLMAAADVVALSSLFEGLPKTAVQAVASGRSFVGTDVNGTSEIIRDGIDGFLVPPRQPKALSHALGRALDLKPVAADAEARVAPWDATLMVKEQEQLYLELAAAGWR